MWVVVRGLLLVYVVFECCCLMCLVCVFVDWRVMCPFVAPCFRFVFWFCCYVLLVAVCGVLCICRVLVVVCCCVLLFCVC